MGTSDVFKVLKVARPAGECNLKTTSISKLQNIKIKRDNYSIVYIHSNNTNINLLNIFCSLAPNRMWKCARAARLFFLVQPVRFLIHDVDVAVDVVDA